MQRALARGRRGRRRARPRARLPGRRHDRPGAAPARSAGADRSRREWELVRAVAQADGSVGRIVDGHYNAVERIELLRRRAAAQRPPRGGRGRPAVAGRLGRRPGARRGRAGARRARGDELRSKASRPSARAPAACTARSSSPATATRGASPTSTSPRASRSTARGSPPRACAPPRATSCASTARASIALLGGPDELLREPWFGRDAIRTAATWAGIADAARAAALEALAPRALGRRRPRRAGRRAHRHARADHRPVAGRGRAPRGRRTPTPSLRALSVHLREAVARAAQALVDEALRRRRLAAAGAAAAPWTAPPATCASSCSSTASTRCSCAPDARRSTGDARSASTSRPATPPTPTRGTSRRAPTSATKYERTLAALGDRRYARGLRGRLLDRRLHRAARRRAATTLLARRHRARRAVDAARERLAARRPRPRRAPHAAGASGRPARSTSSSARRSSTTGTAPTLERRAARDRATSLAPGGRLVAVHYRPPSSDRPADRRRRPRAAARAPGPRATSTRDANDHFRIDVFDA